MSTPFASVLIDTYNHARFIEQAIVSVLEQDFAAREREVIVVDDGSTDRTPEIVAKFSGQVRYLRKQNGGQASAFNAGFAECRGEIVAFLDGDDWWAPRKLSAVAETLAAEPDVGLVGHGIIEVLQDRGERLHVSREESRFRLNSGAAAREFRLRKSFLGTSRMTCRTSVLKRIGPVPEALRIQADEFLFTMAGVFAGVVIRREALTYYRLHDANAFQIADGDEAALRRKHGVLSALARELQAGLARAGVAAEVAEPVLAAVRVEAELIRLELENGFPWETIGAEWRNYRIIHEEASPLRRVLKGASLLPALVMPSRKYFQLRQRMASSRFYRRARARWLPFSRHGHVEPHSAGPS